MLRPLTLAVPLLVCAWPFPDARSRPPEIPSESAILQDASDERTNLKTLVEGCRKCHEDVCDEWAASQHAKSFTDPVFQAEIATLEDKGERCMPCHAPQEVLATGIGKLPKGRKLDRELGVNCVTCHLKGNSYHGPYDSTGHGGIDAEPEYRKSNLCLSCHGQPEVRKEHDQGTSFLAGPAAASGATCQSCHMTAVDRKLVTSPTIKEKYTIGIQPCRKHDFLGARRSELVKGAADVTVAFGNGAWTATILPKTGHGLPATTHRAVVLEVVFSSGDGRELGRVAKTWRFPEGPTLPPAPPTVVPLEAPDGAVRAKAVLRQVLEKTGGRDEDVVQIIQEAEGAR